MTIRRASGWLALAGAVLLASCGDPVGGDEPPAPALFEISDAQGNAQGWLFGTIHALPARTEWRTPKFDKALAGADILAVELNLVDDQAEAGKTFARLAATPGLPPLTQRVGPQFRGKLADLMKRGGMKDGTFASTETWAAALTLSNVDTGDDSYHSIDRLLARDFEGPLVELEGLENQLAIFDRLPEEDQRALLESIVADSGDVEADRLKFANSWRSGDLETLMRDGEEGLLADPQLREAILVGRNRDWAEKIDALIRSGRKTFTAVGAGHLAGPDGLAKMLAARGWTVKRIQ